MQGYIRRRPVHPRVVATERRPTVVFLTICAKDRKPILATGAAHQVIVEAWARADTWVVGRYVVMPDHVHLFCAPRDDEISLAAWVHYWKSLSSKHWPQPAARPVWQPDFWDTRLRRGDRYESKWEYVRANPVRAGLVEDPDDWPYAGELYTLSWS